MILFDCDDSSLQLQYIEESEFELHSTLNNNGENDNNSRIDFSINCTNTDDAGDIVIAAKVKKLKATNRHSIIMAIYYFQLVAFNHFCGIINEESNIIMSPGKLSLVTDVSKEETVTSEVE